jgi:hypothetical protein
LVCRFQRNMIFSYFRRVAGRRRFYYVDYRSRCQR